ncbi:hypothetical protein Tco_0879077 [Tanacetum coccineum]
MMVTFLYTHLFPKPSGSSIQEDNKLKKHTTSYLMKALKLSNSQNLQLMISTLLSQNETHLMNIFITLNLLKADASLDQNDQANLYDQADLNDHPIAEPPSSSTKDASTPNAVSTIQTESPSSIPSMATPTPQDRWSK